MSVRGYRDAAGSIPDEADRSLNRELQSGVRALAEEVSRAADTRDSSAAACARRNLGAWAADGALLSPPDSFAAARQMLRYATGMNIGAAKLAAANEPLSPSTIAWLGQVTRAAAESFQRRAERSAPVDNLYVWSGVAAASHLLLTPNSQLRTYENRVWHTSIDAIGPDGLVQAELRRASRSLSYHTYYLSALLWLSNIRSAIGEKPSQADVAAIDRLRKMVIAGVCGDPRTLGRSRSPQSQIKPTPAAYRSVIYLDDPTTSDRLSRCGLASTSSFDPFLGGDIQKSREFLKRGAK